MSQPTVRPIFHHVSQEEARKVVHGTGFVGHFNSAIAVWVTNKVGSMWCAYLFCLIALVSLPATIQQTQATHSPVLIVQWVAQTFLQLVLLSVIMVGQRVQQEASDQRSLTDHDILTALHTMNQTQLDILKRLDK